MAYLKAAIVIITSLLIVLIFITVLLFNPEEELSKALNYYIEDNISEAETALARLQSSLAPMQYYLYKAYLDRANNNFELSNKDLKDAEDDALEHANFNVLLEILLNEALNAYLTNDDKTLARIVKKAMKFGGPDEDWVLLFRGVLAYREGNYAKALKMWKVDKTRVPLSAWMSASFPSTFTDYWLVTRVARSNIEIGNFVVARQLLEQQIPLLSGEELENILFLMGYSYAKEAASKKGVNVVPYYKLALFYFNRIPFMTDRFKSKRDEIIEQVYNQIQESLSSSDYKDFSYYLTLLDRWHGTAEIKKVKEQLTEQFKRAFVLNSLEQAEEIYPLLRMTAADETEKQQFEETLKNAIGKNTLQDLEQYVRSGKLFTENVGTPLEKSLENTKQSLQEPSAALLSIQELIDHAVDDKKVNPYFRIERSLDLQKALKQLNDFTDTHKNIPQALIMEGQVRYLLGDYAGSSEAYEAAILLDPRNPVTYRYMALVYEEVGQYDDAILILLQGLKYAPKNADLWEQLAGDYMATGNELDAIPSYKEAVRINPLRTELYLALGRLQVDLEMPEEATKNLAKYLSSYPEDHEALALMLKSLYNPLRVIEPADLMSYEKQRDDIYHRLYKIAPEEAEKIRKNYHAPPPVVAPPPEPEPNLPFLPQ